ncbi:MULTISPECIES: S-layer family protein [Pseudomonas]|uniref:S-layer family protein n=1 Tax=Pseudomonas sp. MEJ086 TaxID=3040319 RepID=UPI0006985D4A|nr:MULTISPECIES: S-layer family protein [Pseudomonas]
MARSTRILFRWHPRHLIETNPALANLGDFLNSDYLLSKLDYDPDQAQKSLGYGLYEQRLIRDAITARTDQRFIAGQDSDEAMFRYLMNNAIASKESLQLTVGVIDRVRVIDPVIQLNQ